MKGTNSLKRYFIKFRVSKEFLLVRVFLYVLGQKSCVYGYPTVSDFFSPLSPTLYVLDPPTLEVGHIDWPLSVRLSVLFVYTLFLYKAFIRRLKKIVSLSSPPASLYFFSFYSKLLSILAFSTGKLLRKLEFEENTLSDVSFLQQHIIRRWGLRINFPGVSFHSFW